MALKSNRVGVRTDQVDAYGRVISNSFFQSILDHLPRWTSLKVWKNGTEQLLPVNTDEPVTSPIVADIQYPTDSSATEQMFTYRESPTEVDGEAYVQSIKGNTIKWNQLIQNGNFADATNWKAENNNSTLTVSSNYARVTLDSGTYSAYNPALGQTTKAQVIADHVYFTHFEVKPSKSCRLYVSSTLLNTWRTKTLDSSLWNIIEGVYKANGSGDAFSYIGSTNGSLESDDYIDYRLFQLYDLTTMFGSTKAEDILAMETAQAGTGVAYFKSLYPLSYYKYDAGSLLSFNGTGIKTVGKNMAYLEQGSLAFDSTGAEITSANRVRTNFISVEQATNYKASSNGWVVKNGCSYDENYNYLGYNCYPTSGSFNLNTTYGNAEASQIKYVRFIYGKTDNTNCTPSDYWYQFELGTTATPYEPYTTSTIIIPTDTYFPTGMKSAGDVYDEFTSSRAYTRVGSVDLGTIIWSYRSEYTYPYFEGSLPATAISGQGHSGEKSVTCYPYETITNRSASNFRTEDLNKKCCLNTGVTTKRLLVQDSSYTDVTTFTSAMNGVMLHYELAEEIIEPTLEFDEE